MTFMSTKRFTLLTEKYLLMSFIQQENVRKVGGGGDKREEETELIFTFSLFHQFQFAGRPRGLTLQTINFSNIKLSGK